MALTRSTLVRIAGGLLVFAVFLGAVLGGHFYLASGLVWEPQLPEPYRGLALAVIFGFFGLMVLDPFAERLVARRYARILAWPASVWMGFAFLGVVVLGACDLLLVVGRGAVAVFGGADFLAPSPELARVRAVVVLGATLFAGLYALREGLSFPRVRRVDLALDRWPRARDGFRIVQLSDIHIGSLRGRGFAAQLVARVNELEPDLIAITGDLVDGSVEHLADEVAPFAGLRARHGVFFVTGNHDHYSGATDWAARVEKLGLEVLRNTHRTLGEGEECFVLAGVDDHRGAMRREDGGEDLEAALAGVGPERAVVLLAHDPATFPKASGRGIDLQLSGHTHAGQIWPFRYLVRLATPFVDGIHRRKSATLYVSRGTGFWGPPMRLGSPSEITELRLRRAS